MEDYESYIRLQMSGSDWSYNSRWGDQMESAIISIFSSKDKSKTSIIDIGCGEGRGLAALHKIGFRKLYGVDINGEKILSAKQSSSSDITYFNYDFHDLSKILSEHTDGFDYGFCSHTLEHANDFNTAIQSIMTLIRKALYFIVPIGETAESVIGCNPSHTCPFLDMDHVVARLSSAGIKKYSLLEKRESDGRLGREVWGVVYPS